MVLEENSDEERLASTLDELCVAAALEVNK